MKRKRAGRILFCAALAALVPSLTAGAKNDENTFTFWLANGEKDEFYMDYAENPIIQYLMAQEWGEGDNAATLTLEFDAASSTNPADSFTTLIYGGDFQDVMDLNYSQSSVTQLYDEGIAMDLTELAEEYMPNYMELIRSDPALYREAVSLSLIHI